MKKIDRLLISSFVPPFFVTFMIAMFVLLMQTLWLYIDDIAGKGLGLFLIMELLAYKCVSLIPLALPLAMLISSVMVLGNLAEHYELSSFKSAGVRLLRIMRPLMLFGVLSTAFSYFCSNNLIPVANLKFGSRMYDIQRQKPALRLDAGVFNDDFQGYAIHIGRKDTDDRTIHDVLIYDHSEATQGRLSQIVAEEGEMFATGDGRYFVMNLKNGHQYIETKPSVRGGDRSYPFIRTSFESWNKVFDLSEFQLSRTNEELFKQNRSMMSSGQLAVAIDSIELRILRRQKSLANHVSSYFTFIEPDSTFLNAPEEADEEQPQEEETEASEEETKGKPSPEPDSMVSDSQPAEVSQRMASREVSVPEASTEKKEKVDPLDSLAALAAERAKTRVTKVTQKKKKPSQKDEFKPTKTFNRYGRKPMEQEIEGDIKDFESLIATFPSYEQSRLYSKAKTFARSIHSQAEASIRSLDRMREDRVKHIYDLHTKYSMAVVCFIFLFIGAPMGAIVRKGGFGYPILISIIFFTIFVILTIFCRKIAESFIVPANAAAWIPCAILFPVGLFLTNRAMNDSKVLDLDRYTGFIIRLIKKLSKKQ